MKTIAALYVDPKGCYSGLPGVEIWDEARDARLYSGPHPVVAHPPCARWGRYWFGGPSAKVRRELGDDGGCFAAAIEAVRRFGGVLEHPEATRAWARFGIAAPPRSGGWIRAGICDLGWTCCVEQGHYGHRARKATWLYLVGAEPRSLTWGPSEGERCIDAGYHNAAERAADRAAGTLRGTERMGKRERAATPLAFRDVLIEMARSVKR
jgi:hypothetical protein